MNCWNGGLKFWTWMY